jgi:hypothetical protein
MKNMANASQPQLNSQQSQHFEGLLVVSNVHLVEGLEAIIPDLIRA